MSRDFAAELAALRVTYLVSLPDRLAHLAGAIAASRHGGTSLAVARGLAHRLRGTAGSYGVPVVAERVGAVEDLLDQVGDGVGDQVPATLWDALERLLTAAREAVLDQAAS